MKPASPMNIVYVLGPVNLVIFDASWETFKWCLVDEDIAEAIGAQCSELKAEVVPAFAGFHACVCV